MVECEAPAGGVVDSDELTGLWVCQRYIIIVAVKAWFGMTKVVAARRKGDGGTGRSGRVRNDDVVARRAEREEAELSRLVDGFEARLQEIEVARAALLKQLAS
jgi:hypothetical protein